MTDSPVFYFQGRTCDIFSFTGSTFLNSFFFFQDILALWQGVPQKYLLKKGSTLDLFLQM